MKPIISSLPDGSTRVILHVPPPPAPPPGYDMLGIDTLSLMHTHNAKPRREVAKSVARWLRLTSRCNPLAVIALDPTRKTYSISQFNTHEGQWGEWEYEGVT